MVASRRKAFIGIVMLVLVAAAWATVRAQGLGQGSSGSLAELTAEVRQLRMVIHDAGRNQTQMQGLSIALTAQQSRLIQVGNRLDALNDQLLKASDKAQKVGQELDSAQRKLPTLTGADRLDLENLIRGLKFEHGPLAHEEETIRARQMEALNVFRQEETRWLELVARLEAILKK